jgi:hypothetical protein
MKTGKGTQVMATKFYGPWYVVLGLVNGHFSQRLLITGSDNADGIYSVRFGNGLVLSVQGSEWQIEMQYFPFDPSASWRPSQVHESMRFLLGDGLVIQLDGAARPPEVINPQFQNLSLTCTSMDSELNPIPTTNPYDFTIPHSYSDDHGRRLRQA